MSYVTATTYASTSTNRMIGAVMAVPAKYNITGYRGDSFSLNLSFTNADGEPVTLPVTAWTAQIRKGASSVAAEASFTVDASEAATGVVSISLTPEQTATLTGGVWDIQLDDGGVVRTYLRGSVSFEGDVTR